MKILDVKDLPLAGAKVIRFARFRDERGYFAEHFRRSAFQALGQKVGIDGGEFVQANESRSRANVCRGLHFQWNPLMGKLVRTTLGRMVDMVLDLRKNSPTLGRIVLYDMPYQAEADFSEWIWVPPGFAHGNYFTEESAIEYFCTGEYNPACEAGLSPLAPDFFWELADLQLREEFLGLIQRGLILSEKDRSGLKLKDWLADPRSQVFGEDFKL
ncbi:MAG: dTDP-4-dehydrorhamnose 3,5-epimerase family protein [Deltaproteobacteria bacterium]|jgi:dTDP-4-dehydrorhamnose 3,5-epimerase|nr:dTDP-4-dehydrorhamnose 3,5-epimerase family protein [Deltaproteobacteria bacterium]